MENFTTVQVLVHGNGIVRVYGNGGMIFETKGEYVKVETIVDPQPARPSGELTVKKP